MQNIEQLVAGDYDIAFSLADTAADAVEGKGRFNEPQPVQALGRIHTNYTQVVARKDANIDSDRGLQGQDVSHRLAEVGHRGDREPADRGRRAQPATTSPRSGSTSTRASTG